MRYGILFEVEILHDYFLNLGSVVHETLDDAVRRAARRAYSVASYLEVAPTARTARVLAGHRAIFKATAIGFRVGIRLDSAAADDRPAIPLGDDFRLAFALSVRDPRFWNYTALSGSAPGFYRFSNASGNEAAGGRFLSLPVPAFDAGRAYEAGEVRSATSGSMTELFRALRDTGPSAAPVADHWQRLGPEVHDPTDTYSAGSLVLAAGNEIFQARVDNPGTDLADADDWRSLGTLALQYPTAADRRVLRPALFALDLAAGALPAATVRLLRPGETTAVWERTYAADGGTLGTVQVDLRGLAPGAYALEVLDGALAPVAGLGFDLYLDPEAVRGGWLGVIEIGAGSGGLALLEAGGALRSPRFTLRFSNRDTRWRYIFPAVQTVGTGAEVAAEPGSAGRVLVTAAPRPLTRFGTGVRLQADDPATSEVSEEVLLPEPATQRIRRQSPEWLSEIHMLNLPL